jgi:hypothetical protein
MSAPKAARVLLNRHHREGGQMQRRTRVSLVAAAALALVLLAVPTCKRKPADPSVGSTDTIQSTPQTTGTTATETGGGKPVTTTSATSTTATTTTKH